MNSGPLLQQFMEQILYFLGFFAAVIGGVMAWRKTSPGTEKWRQRVDGHISRLYEKTDDIETRTTKLEVKSDQFKVDFTSSSSVLSELQVGIKNIEVSLGRREENQKKIEENQDRLQKSIDLLISKSIN